MKKHNVLLVHWGQTGGGPRFLYELAKAWQSQHPQEVYLSFNQSADRASQLFELGLPNLSVATYRRTTVSVLAGLPRLPFLAWKFRRFLKKHKIDVVVSVMPSIYQSIVIPLSLPRHVQYISSIHDSTPHLGEANPVTKIVPRLERRRADYIAVFSKSVADQIRMSHKGSIAPIITTVHPAWSNRSTTPPEPRQLPEHGPFTLGFLGRLIPYKGLDTLIAACRILLDKGIDIRLAVHGQGPDAILRSTAEDLPGDWHIGWIPENSIDSIVQSFDVLVLPYKEASQSGVVADALSHGVPMVATPVGGLIEQILTTSSGIVADEATPEALAEAIATLLSDDDRYRHYSASGLQAATSTHSWGQVVSDLREHLIVP